MIRFKLFDENDGYAPYILNLNFQDEENDFEEWVDSNPAFENFMEKMETTNAPWSGVHDYSEGKDKDGIEYIGYSSYEIKDFSKAISMWADFFRKHGKLIEKPQKKLVKESLTENVHNKNEMEKYMYDNFDVIVNQYVIKLQKIFKDLLPWDNDSEYALEDAAGIWWMEIVEPGWEPEILKNLPKRLDSNELIEIEDKAVEKAFEIIGVPHEITY